jgi:CRISPR/Cas system CSM-associated protein Csm3 (group 7 of RAMP superfamily)
MILLMTSLTQLTQDILEEIQITATIDTGLCIGAGGATSSMTDKSIVRNAQGQLIIPGSHLKGRLRHECEKLARSLGWIIAESPIAEKLYLVEADGQVTTTAAERFQREYQQVAGYPGWHCWISRWFGDPIVPSRIVVNDLICDYARDELPQVVRPGVALNRRRQTAEDRRLFFRETSPVNVQLEFHGAIQIYSTGVSSEDLQAIKLLLMTALRHVNALGGGKSAGTGWLNWQLPQVEITPEILNRLKRGSV